MSIKIRGKLYNLDVIANLVSKKKIKTNNRTRNIDLKKFSETDFMEEVFSGKPVKQYITKKQKTIVINDDPPVLWCKDNHYGVITGYNRIINAILDKAVTIECVCISLNVIDKYA